jgi:hypothetical protein
MRALDSTWHSSKSASKILSTGLKNHANNIKIILTLAYPVASNQNASFLRSLENRCFLSLFEKNKVCYACLAFFSFCKIILV